MAKVRSANRQLQTVKIARKIIQLGFLFIFLFPFFPELYRRVSFEPMPTLSTWLLVWDPLLFVGQIFNRDWPFIVIGGPLLVFALTFLFGRSICGWVCPMGTVLDLFHGAIGWMKRKRKQHRPDNKRNSRFRYYVLLAALVASVFSLQLIGFLDPFVVINRAITAITSNYFSFQQPALRVYVSVLSLVFIGMLILEFWKPRFWCKNICPSGALFSLVSRWSVLNRKVTSACTGCGECSRYCPMQAIPKDPHLTDYTDCTFCLECESTCPKNGISFGFGDLAGKTWQKQPAAPDALPIARFAGKYASDESRRKNVKISRRQFIGGSIAGLFGILMVPLGAITSAKKKILRPPGALPDDEFVKTCIVCQECVRVCPTGGLRPTFLESGLGGIGTPQLIPRLGGCSINPSCPNLCAKVCPVGAIQPIQPDELNLGVAKVDHSLCLAWDQGVKCLVCVEACLSQAALVYQGRIIVDVSRCTGCGRCESGCPVAGSAIRVFPTS